MTEEKAGIESELSALLSSASLVFVGTVVSSVSKLVERILLGRMLTPDAFGDITILLSIVTMTVTISMIGFSQGIPRFLSRYEQRVDRRGVWATGAVVTGTGALVSTTVLILAANWIAPQVLEHTDSVQLLQLFALSIPLLVGFKVGMGGIRGMENTVYKALVSDFLYPIGRLGLMFGLLSLGYGVFAAGYAYLIAAAAVCLVAHAFLNRLLPLIGSVRTHFREMITFSAPLLVSTVLATFLWRTDTIMLGYFKSSTVVGLYSAAYPIARGMLLVLASFGFLYLPLASRLDADDKHEEITRIYEITTKWVYILTFPIVLLFVTFPGDVLTILFGEQYAPAAPTLVVLAAGFFTSAAAGRNRETVSVLGRTNVLLVVHATVLGLNILLNLFLIPRYGHRGAALASAASNVALNTILLLFLKREYGMTPVSPWSVRTFVALPVALVPAALLLSQYVTLSAIGVPVFLIAAGLGCIAVVCLVGALQPEDTIAIEYLEDLLHVRLWFIRRFLPPDQSS